MTEKNMSNQTPQLTAKAAANTSAQETKAAPAPSALPADRAELPELIPEKPKKKDTDPTFWFVVAVGLLGIGALLYFVLPGWLNKRKKSYGF